MQKSKLIVIIFMFICVGFIDSWHAQMVSSLAPLVSGLLSKARYALSFSVTLSSC